MNSDLTILAVDDNEESLFALSELLKLQNFTVFSENKSSKAFELAYEVKPDVILLDVMMPEINGLELTKKFKSDPYFKYVPVVLLSSMQDLDDVLKGFAVGADDYIGKPFKKDELLARLNAVLRTRKLYLDLAAAERENTVLQDIAEQRSSFSNIIGKSKSIRQIFSLVERVADTQASVLIRGESGTGKELIAQALHFNSSRKNKPFIIQNCSALSEQLLESELFGHVKGAFTGAVKDKQGLFEVANGGTFFLDELGEMTPALQVKLLRVLQDGSFTPVGSTQAKKVDVRVLAATNRDLESMMTKGEFREDLYYRLNVVTLELPPLRERREDIPLLVEFFSRSLAEKNNIPKKQIDPLALGDLVSYDWPGNIRQLQNELERALIMSGSSQIMSRDHFSTKVCSNNDSLPSTSEGSLSLNSSSLNLKQAQEDLEKTLITAANERFSGNKTHMAKELGLSRSSLISKMKAYNINS